MGMKENICQSVSCNKNSTIGLLVVKSQCFVARDAVFPDVFYYDPMIKNQTLFYDFDDNKHKKPVSRVILVGGVLLLEDVRLNDVTCNMHTTCGSM